VALIRCTCIYRPALADERTAGAPAVVVVALDPFCPAGATHGAARGPKPARRAA
jgi:hypothetical protein